MVYISSWQDFQEAVEALYARSPNKARYCVKWKASEGKLVLKLTDDSTCLKYKTYSSAFLNRFDVLNKTLIRKMQNAQAIVPKAEVRQTETSKSERPETPISTPISASSPAGGVKKKKGKKKK